MSYVAYINRWDGDSPGGCRDAILIGLKRRNFSLTKKDDKIRISLQYTFSYINDFILDKRRNTAGKIATFKTIDEAKTILNAIEFTERTDGNWECYKSRLRIVNIEFMPLKEFKKLLPLILAEQKLKEVLDKPA